MIRMKSRAGDCTHLAIEVIESIEIISRCAERLCSLWHTDFKHQKVGGLTRKTALNKILPK
jgi:hypothetical protein